MIARREKVKAEYGSRFVEVSEILFRNDPIGINFESNTDEYEPEVETILPRLKNCFDVRDVLNVVYEEFQKWFDNSAGDIEKYKGIAEEIWLLCKNRKIN